MLGMWEESHIDLCAAQKNDFDEDVAQWIKDVAPNVNFDLFYKDFVRKSSYRIVFFSEGK
jgi:hypothetical protein